MAPWKRIEWLVQLEGFHTYGEGDEFIMSIIRCIHLSTSIVLRRKGSTSAYQCNFIHPFTFASYTTKG